MLFTKTAADGTNRVRVKICGLTREDDVVAVTDAGADAVGFVCYPGSSRFVPPTRLIGLACLVPEGACLHESHGGGSARIPVLFSGRDAVVLRAGIPGVLRSVPCAVFEDRAHG